MSDERKPMVGEIRMVNFIVDTIDGKPLWNHMMQQYHPDGVWRQIPVYDRNDDGTLVQITGGDA